MFRSFLAAAAACLALAACHVPSTGDVASNSSSIANTVTVDSTKGLILVELAYKTANAELQVAVANGLHGEAAAKARNANQIVTTALAQANAGIDVAANVAKAVEAIANINSVLPAAK